MRTCRPTVGSAPSRLVTSPRRHSGRSSTNISRRRSPRAAQWACGSSQLESDQQTSQHSISNKVPKRSSLVVRRPGVIAVGVRPTSQNCISLGRAVGLWVITIRPTSHNCYPQVTRAVALVVFKCRYSRT